MDEDALRKVLPYRPLQGSVGFFHARSDRDFFDRLEDRNIEPDDCPE